jgi:hypothetical protein
VAAVALADAAGKTRPALVGARARHRLEVQDQDQAVISRSPVAGLVVDMAVRAGPVPRVPAPMALPVVPAALAAS